MSKRSGLPFEGRQTTEQTENICCMFSDPDPGHAVENNALECLEDEEWSRKRIVLYRCKRCGGFVLYEYHEDPAPGWDYTMICEEYIPVAEPPLVNGKYSCKAAAIGGARSIHTMYLEEEWRDAREWHYR